jgi:RES domain-containing protein
VIPRQYFQGMVYRAHHPMWAYSPLSGEGAKRFGGRFNRPGLAALYTALDFTTAWLEAQQGFPFKPQPLTLVAYQVDCTDIVDLHEPEVQASLGIHHNDLACAWEMMMLNQQIPPTWVITEHLLQQGCAGLLVRSFAPGCSAANRNLVLFDWGDSQPHAIQVVDDLGRLPHNPTSWNR